MKILKGSIFMLFISLLYFFEVNVVNATNYNGYIYQGEKIDGIYFYKHRSDTEDITYETHNFHEQATVYRRSTDNAIVYCIQNWAKLTGAETGDYQEYTMTTQKTGLSKEQLLKIEAIGYFGYGYKDATHDHSEQYWYAITQYLIWQVESPNIETYFVSSLTSSTPLNIYQNEMNEILSLVDRIDLFPNFNTNDLKHVLYDNIHLTDMSGSINIDNTTITTAKKSNIIKSGNNITIKPLDKGILAGNLTISRKGNRLNRITRIYQSDNYQNAILIGDYSSRSKNYTINDRYSELTIGKLCESLRDYKDDNFTYNKGACTNNVLIYAMEDVYNNDNELVIKKDQLIENSNQYIFKLYPTKYRVEMDNVDRFISKSYSTDLTNSLDKKTHISLSFDYQHIEFSIKKYKEEFIKNENRYDYIDGNNFEFELYANNDIISETDNSIIFNKDELIRTITSDAEGNIIIDNDLPYGSYYLKEMNTNSKYQENNTIYTLDFYIEGDESKRYVKLDDIYNNLNKNIINIYIRDEEDNKPLSNINVSIYDDSDTLIYRTNTDNNGYIRVELPYDDYYIKQEDTLIGYTFSNEKILCHLDEEEKTVEITNKYHKVSSSGGIEVPDKDVIIEGDVTIDEDGIVVDVPSTYYSDYSFILIVFILVITICGYLYEKNNN